MSTEPELREVVKIEGIRKVIARRMSQSKREAPHVYFDIEVDMNAASSLKVSLAEKGQKVSYNDMIIFAVSRNLKEFPHFNAHLKEDELYVYEDINVGMAVGLEEGLIVPVIHNTDQKRLVEIADLSRELIERARSHKLKLADYTGGTFTISNLGMYDLTTFHAVINPPEVAILAVGKVAPRPVIREGKIEPSLVANFSLSVDHRVIDGLEAARFLYSFKSILENIQNYLMG